MAMDASEFLGRLLADVPEIEPTVHEHLDDNDGELLLHPLTADLQRLALTWFEEGRNEPLTRLLQVLAIGLTSGSGHVEGSVALSFVEFSGWWEPEMRDFVAAWPRELQEEVKTQRRVGTLNREPRNPDVEGEGQAG